MLRFSCVFPGLKNNVRCVFHPAPTRQRRFISARLSARRRCKAAGGTCGGQRADDEARKEAGCARRREEGALVNCQLTGGHRRTTQPKDL